MNTFRLLSFIPAGLFAMLQIPGLGPKKVKALYDKLKIASIEQLGETIAGRRQPFDTLPNFEPVWLGRSA